MNLKIKKDSNLKFLKVLKYINSCEFGYKISCKPFIRILKREGYHVYNDLIFPKKGSWSGYIISKEKLTKQQLKISKDVRGNWFDFIFKTKNNKSKCKQ
jgi:hypothetical protein